MSKEMQRIADVKEAELVSVLASLPDDVFLKLVTDAGLLEMDTDKSTVKVVQETLNAAGYNCGTPDGVAGAKTTEQINRYETEKGLVVNGIITDQLLESLGIADQLEEQAKIEAEKASYSGDYSYEQLARNPDTYIGEKIRFSGKVLQVI